MANERTFLAWIRTSIGIMAFGFVVEKFALFLKQLSHYFYSVPPDGTKAPALPAHTVLGYSSVTGIFLVGFGALMAVLSFIRYKQVERQIDTDTYQPSLILDILLTLSILVVGFFLMIYILHSI